ncbi:hypothetical protein GCM10007385_40900 [Tateyamaria omphalii]|uniref:hypothetical protein n=1 Tax=Tateyamaria omphalii TaxID=299262 RepID=UPI00198F9310|nr:hypothetical protein [Tateyamaria omphalii]GGX67570.1 hypothetical protein GCM10007385_40900 [Tateyamaria omphalii]
MQRYTWVSGVTRTSTFLTVSLALVPATAHAYVGPGAGLTAIGTMIALVAALVLAVVGFVWYPIKRMVRARKAKTDIQAPRETES